MDKSHMYDCVKITLKRNMYYLTSLTSGKCKTCKTIYTTYVIYICTICKMKCIGVINTKFRKLVMSLWEEGKFI